jgi:hypothetical protein
MNALGATRAEAGPSRWELEDPSLALRLVRARAMNE